VALGPQTAVDVRVSPARVLRAAQLCCIPFTKTSCYRAF